MANTKASKKDILRIKRNRLRNQQYKTRLKSSLKTAYSTISNITDETETQVRETCRFIDKVASKGILKKNAAGRKKSRLVIAFNKAKLAKG